MAREYKEAIYMGVAPVTRINATNVYMADGSTLQEQADKKFELIEEITLTEDTAIIERNTEPDGTAYNFTDVVITCYTPNTSTTGFNGTINIANISPYFLLYNAAAANAERYSKCFILNTRGLYLSLTSGGSGENSASNAIMQPRLVSEVSSIDYIKIAAPGSSVYPANSVIKIYAVRA